MKIPPRMSSSKSNQVCQLQKLNPFMTSNMVYVNDKLQIFVTLGSSLGLKFLDPSLESLSINIDTPWSCSRTQAVWPPSMLQLPCPLLPNINVVKAPLTMMNPSIDSSLAGFSVLLIRDQISVFLCNNLVNMLPSLCSMIMMQFRFCGTSSHPLPRLYIFYPTNPDLKLSAFVDSDWASCLLFRDQKASQRLLHLPWIVLGCLEI